MENMNIEICDYYEPMLKNYRNRLCKHFNGDKDNKRHLERCRYHCSMINCSECMKEKSYKRVKGVLRQVK